VNVLDERAKVLVVVSGQPDSRALRARLEDWVKPDTQVQVVVSPQLSRLEWLTNAEDAAHEEAQELADEAGAATAQQAELEPQVGDSDTVQAIEDVLRTFAADEVLVVLTGKEDETAEALMKNVRELGIPLHTLEIPSTPD
jgi:recombination DNA repair RAD52 pathway protein